MQKILKGFFLSNGFEGKVGETVSDDEFSKKEIVSLTKDGSIEKAGAKAPKKASKPKKK